MKASEHIRKIMIAKAKEKILSKEWCIDTARRVYPRASEDAFNEIKNELKIQVRKEKIDRLIKDEILT